MNLFAGRTQGKSWLRTMLLEYEIVDCDSLGTPQYVAVVGQCRADGFIPPQLLLHTNCLIKRINGRMMSVSFLQPDTPPIETDSVEVYASTANLKHSILVCTFHVNDVPCRLRFSIHISTSLLQQ